MTAAEKITQSAVYEMLMQSQHWSADQMLAFQRSQLEQLVRHAKSTVPFYNNRLDCLFRSNGSIDWDRWTDVPILKRQDVAENFDALQTTSLPLAHGNTQIASTSGSTGLPISVTYTKLLSDVCKAADWRAHANWDINWSENLVYWHKYNDRYSSRGPLHDYGPWGPSVDVNSKNGRSYVGNTDQLLAERLNHLGIVNARNLIAAGNVIMAAALSMAETGQISLMQNIITHGVKVEPQFDSAIATTFGADLRSLYSSKEGGRMAHMCAQCRRYHVNSELLHMEILDGNNVTCPPGKSGRVVITNFYNAAQPFIRYDHGDLATWAKGCICGSKLPTLESIDGRVYHLFRRLNGETFAPQITDDFRSELDAVFWQFVQVSPRTILVKYKPSDKRDTNRETHFSAKLQSLLNENYDIGYEIVSELPLTASGKFLKYLYAVS
jgi:phenylacetate-CoA ligase